MQFLYPAFLFALAALAIPILIHLFNFRKYKTVYFSNVALLKEVNEETTNRAKLKHWLVLLCRMAAIIMLVLAFAQPFIPSGNQFNQEGKKCTAVYLDNSFSMGGMKNNMRLLDNAKAEARMLVEQQPADARFLLLTNELSGRHQRELSKDEMLAQLNEVELHPAFRNMADISARISDLFALTGATNKTAYLFSDFQQSAGLPKTDSSIHYILFPLQAQENRNLFIDSCWFEEPLPVIGRSARLLVRLGNSGNSEADNQRLQLKLNGQTKALAEFSMGPNERITDTLTFVINKAGWNEAQLIIQDYPISFDDVYYLSFEAMEKLPVMVVSGQQPLPYLAAAFASDSAFSITRAFASSINLASLKQQRLVALENLSELPTGLSDALLSYVNAGGNLVVFLPEKPNITDYNRLLAAVQAGTLGDFRNSGVEAGKLNAQHRIVKNIFEKIPDNMLLPQVRKCHLLNTAANTKSEPIIQLKDGSPLLTGTAYGSGHLFVCTAPLGKEYSDFAFSPLFAPMLFEMAMTQTQSSDLAHFIGSQSDIAVDNAIGHDEVLYMKGNNLEFIPEQFKAGNTVFVRPGTQLSQAGLYRLTQENVQREHWVSMNYHRSESLLSFYDAETLQKKLAEANISILNTANPNTAEIGSQLSQGTPLWKWCIVLALLFFALETALLRWMK